jgi:uncharacterized protein (DUF2384 family)
MVINMAGQFPILKKIPYRISDSEVQKLLRTSDINWYYMAKLKEYAALQDEILSNWLNISVKTFRTYKKPENTFKDNLKEQIILLFSLFKHGIDIFGTREEFNQWLNTKNFFFDNNMPVSYLNTITGIRFVDNRLTAMEFGDNV